jgi:hypothetical protein
MQPLKDSTPDQAPSCSRSSDLDGSAMIGSRYTEFITIVFPSFFFFMALITVQVYNATIRTPTGRKIGSFEYRIVDTEMLQLYCDSNIHSQFFLSERVGDVRLPPSSFFLPHQDAFHRNSNALDTSYSRGAVALIRTSTKAAVACSVPNSPCIHLHSCAARTMGKNSLWTRSFAVVVSGRKRSESCLRTKRSR